MSDLLGVQVSEAMEPKTIPSDSRGEDEGVLRSAEPVEEEGHLVFGSKMMCPWCDTWRDILAYTRLQIPPDFPKQVTQIYKCGGEEGCKGLFALKE